jgi:hypothetical protein
MKFGDDIREVYIRAILLSLYPLSYEQGAWEVNERPILCMYSNGIFAYP